MKGLLDAFSLADWRNKGMALGLACLVWWVVSDLTDGVSEPFEVPVVFELPENYTLIEPRDPRITIVVSGPKGMVNDIVYQHEQVKALHHLNVTSEMEDNLVLEPISPHDFSFPSGIAVAMDPERLPVKVARKVQGRLEVVPQLTGQPAPDYEVVLPVRATPSEIRVEGPALVFERHSTIPTEPIDLRGRTRSFSVDRRLVQELEGVPLPSDGTVRVQVDLRAVPAERTLERIPVRIMSLPEQARRVSLHTGSRQIDIKVRGPRTKVESLRPEDVKVWVDVSSDLPRDVPYQRRPEAGLPEGVEMVDVPEVIYDVEAP